MSFYAIGILKDYNEQILRSPDERNPSIAVCWSNGKRYADIEFYNDGAVLICISNGYHLPKVWVVDPTRWGIRDAMELIAQFLYV